MTCPTLSATFSRSHSLVCLCAWPPARRRQTPDGVPGSFHTAGSPHHGSQSSPSSSRTICLSQGTACALTRFAPSWLAGLTRLSLGVVYLVTWNNIMWVVVFFSAPHHVHTASPSVVGELCASQHMQTPPLCSGQTRKGGSQEDTQRELLFRNNMIYGLFKLFLCLYVIFILCI